MATRPIHVDAPSGNGCGATVGGAPDEHLRAVLDSMLDPYVLLTAVRDDEGRIVDFVYTDANPRACAYNGRTREELIGSRLLELLPGHASTGLLASYAAVVETGEPLVLDDLVYGPEFLGGTPRRFEVRAVRVGDGLSYTWRDVTDRYEQQERLRDSEERFRELAENAADVVYRTGPDQVITWVSPGVRRLFGWVPEEVVGRTIAEFVHPGDASALTPSWDGAVASAGPDGRDVEAVRLRTAQGSYRWVSAHVAPVSGDGDDGGLVVGLRDVHDLVLARAESERVRAEVERTRLSMDVAAIGMAITSPSMQFIEVNPALCTMFGYDRNELVGRTFAEFTHPDDVGRGVRAMQELASGQRQTFHQRKRYVVRDGRTVWVDLSVAAVREDDGSLRHCVAQMVDVTSEVATQDALERAVHRYRLLAENASDIVYQTNPRGEIQWVSPSVQTVLGWDAEMLIGSRAIELVHPDDLREVLRRRGEVYEGRRTVAVQVRYRTSGGDYRHMSVTARPISDAEGIVAAVVSLRDVTAEHEALMALRRSEERFRLAMDGAPQGMAITDADGVLVEVNPALCRMVATDATELIGQHVRGLLVPEDSELPDSVLAELAGSSQLVLRHEHRLAARGEALWVVHSISVLRGDDGEVLYFVHQFLDQTADHRLQDELAHRATHDDLTGLSNRADLMSRLRARLSTSAPSGADTVGVLFCDVDNLKPINDSRGHLAGDTVLSAVAERLARVVRHGDLVGRVGGDEFVVVVEGVTTPDELERVAVKVQATASRPVVVDGDPLEVTISVGAVLARDDEDTDAVLVRADSALYDAKQSGRNRVAVR